MGNQTTVTNQVSFGGGLNALTSPHALGSDEVASSTNIDYSLEWGGALPRRGCTQFIHTPRIGTRTSQQQLVTLARNYGLSSGVWSDLSIPFYAGDNNGNIWVGASATTGGGLGILNLTHNGGASAVIYPQWTQYGTNIYIVNGTYGLRNDGVTTLDWLLPQADTPAVNFVPQAQVSVPFIGFAGTSGSATYTATEGTITSTSTTSLIAGANVILASCTAGTGTRIVLIGTCSVGLVNWENPIPFITPPTGTAITSGGGTYTLGGGIDFHAGWPLGDTTGASGPYNGTSTITQTLTIGNYGTDYLLLSLANQQNVVTIQRDFSIGDTTFTNYWHSETTASAIEDATIDPVTALLEAQGNASLATQQSALNTGRSFLPHVGATQGVHIPPTRRMANKVTVSGSISPWAVSRSDYQFIGALSSPTWTNIQAVRIVIEFSTSAQSAIIGGIFTYGGQGYPLNDQSQGISYFQTFGRVENNVIVAEGAPSVPTAPQKCQFSNALIVCASNTNITAGITHRIFYRTGGLLSDAYRVGSCTITSGTATIVDYNLPDMNIINNPILDRYLWSTWPAPSAGTGLPGVNAVTQTPWQERVWVGVRNQLYWSLPGMPSKIQDNSQTTVSDIGDVISAIIGAQNLVIVNQNSVYEMAGSIFEGTAQNWSLTRTLARRGSAAPQTCISTPYGILLLGYDGISFYRQGWGLDQELQWIYDRIGDAWKGTAATDPAAVKARIPAINLTNIFNACAAYKDEKVYLAVPTGDAIYPNTLFILDMAHQKVWMVTYPFNILSLFWDRVTNRLFAGTDHGMIMQLETTLMDELDGNGVVLQGIAWSYTTREWSNPKDSIWENLQVEGVGTYTWVADADNTNTYTLGTLTASSKGWNHASLQGTIGDNINFIFSGTQSGTQQGIYELEWDAIPLSPRVSFFQTDPIATPSESYAKTWLADLNVFNGTTTGSVLIDGTVIQTATFISSNTGGDITQRRVFEVGLPNVTYGKNVSAIYNSSQSFRHHDTNFEFEPKPFGKLTWLVTYRKAGGASQADMARFYAMDVEGTASMTITNTWIIDGSVFSTNTLVFNASEFWDGGSDAGEEGAQRVRNYMDQIPFPPGGRGYLFQQQMTSAQSFQVWRASLDFDRIGVKGLSRVTANGSPSPGSERS